MLVVPADTPVTIPLRLPTLTAPVPVPALHSPPPAVSLNVTLAPAHTVPGPVIVVGERLTVTVVEMLQPTVEVKVILLVPVVTPVTTPVVGVIFATAVLPLSHVPPPLSVSVICAPTHKADGPPGIAGVGLIVIVAVRVQPVGSV